jgi:putative transposase
MLHNRRSIRLKGYDYSQEGIYFITLCCQERQHHFGKIEDGIMYLNELGEIIKEEWEKTPIIRTNVKCKLRSFYHNARSFSRNSLY